MTYDELCENVITYEQNHINKYNKNDKKKIVAFTAKTFKAGEEGEKTKTKEWLS